MCAKTLKNSKIKPGQEKQNYVPNNNPMSGIFDLPGIGGIGGIGGGSPFQGSGDAWGRVSPLSEPWEMMYNNSYYMLSLLRVVLTYAYVIHGPLRTLVDLPVYDAFRGGIKIKSDEVDAEDIKELHKEIKKLKLVRKTVNALRWERLYGGSALIVNTDQDFKTPFNINTINESSKLSFIVADRWQLQPKGVNYSGPMLYTPGGSYDENNILIAEIDRTRIAKIIGEDAPSLIAQRLQGWGMSVIECVIREINLYFKENNVLFEFIDEAKTDVWKIEGFNAQVLSKTAHGVTALRLRIATWMKNFLNAIVLDSKDDYVQKQLSFSGLAEIMKQIQIGIAAACRMPVSKLFGLASTGFDSGESDLETYNALVTNERDKAEEALDFTIPIVMMKVWGFVPKDWSIEWQPLRVMTAEQEQNVKNSKHQRNMDLYDRGLYTPQEMMEAEKQDDIVTITTEVAEGAEPEPPAFSMMMDEDSEESSDESQSKPSQGKKPTKAKT